MVPFFFYPVCSIEMAEICLKKKKKHFRGFMVLRSAQIGFCSTDNDDALLCSHCEK